MKKTPFGRKVRAGVFQQEEIPYAGLAGKTLRREVARKCKLTERLAASRRDFPGIKRFVELTGFTQVTQRDDDYRLYVLRKMKYFFCFFPVETTHDMPEYVVLTGFQQQRSISSAEIVPGICVRGIVRAVCGDG